MNLTRSAVRRFTFGIGHNLAATLLGVLIGLAPLAAQAQTTAPQPASATVGASPPNLKNFAPGFVTRSEASSLVIVPIDIELFNITGGGVREPRADWTTAAEKHFRATIEARKQKLGTNLVMLEEKDLDELGEINSLHGAVAQSVYLHHMLGHIKLPTKNDRLDWSMGEAVKPLKAKTGADYALFTWVRDSYASAERKAAMFGLALLGIGVQGGVQLGYASLVDLNTGRVVWFNNLARASGDLRTPKEAEESFDELLKGFPVSK
jgi:hypothetical protein